MSEELPLVGLREFREKIREFRQPVRVIHTRGEITILGVWYPALTKEQAAEVAEKFKPKA